MPVTLDRDEKEAIEALYKQIKDLLKVKKMILFGSKARGMIKNILMLIY